MSGVGALFELYSTWKEGKDEKKEKEEEPKLEPEEKQEVEGFLDEGSDWFYVIEGQDWDALLDMLQQFDYKQFLPPKPGKKKRRLRVVKAYNWAKEKIRPSEPEEEVVSPLLAVNKQGQTPLHLAIKNGAPDKYIIRMIFCDKRAALIADNGGQLPLHYACVYERNTPVIDRCIRANFHHMQQEDNEGRTSLWRAVERATIAEETSSRYWGIPRSKEEAEWQQRQEVKWAKVRFILLSYSTRRRIMIESEKEILLTALECAAPPKCVELCILASQGLLHDDPTLSSNALKKFMERQYPIKNLQLLLYHFPVQNVESLEAARKILTDMYHKGNVTPPGLEMSYRAEMEQQCLGEPYTPTLHCREWWDKIRCLLKLCGHGNNKERRKEFENKFLLHAALSNSDTPPSLVQLLMVVKPEAIRLQHPFNQALLIHLICGSWKYNLFPQSKGINIVSELEEPPMEQVLKIILASDRSLVRKRHNDRLPLHLAVVTNKSIPFLEALLDADVKTLAARDPQTKLYPFQLAALGGVGAVSRNAGLWAHAQYTASEWKYLDPAERAKAVDAVREEQDLEQLTTIFTLLRKFPLGVTSGALLKKPAVFRDTRGKGMVSAHYLSFVYSRGIADQFDYELQKDKLFLIQAAIKTKQIPKELEGWWSKMKFWIRYCYTGKEVLKEDENYLLHAAVGNSDTPPLVVQLLLAIYPTSATLAINDETDYPLHIAAATPFYNPQYYELVETPDLLEMLVRAYPYAANYKSLNGKPIEIAVANGKSDDELEPLQEYFVQEIIAGEIMAEVDDDSLGKHKKPDVEVSSQGEISVLTEHTPTTAENTTLSSSHP